MGVNVLVFAVELQKVRTIFDRGLRRVSKLHVCGRGKRH